MDLPDDPIPVRPHFDLCNLALGPCHTLSLSGSGPFSDTEQPTFGTGATNVPLGPSASAILSPVISRVDGGADLVARTRLRGPWGVPQLVPL